jgi:hypothetical protein
VVGGWDIGGGIANVPYLGQRAWARQGIVRDAYPGQSSAGGDRPQPNARPDAFPRLAQGIAQLESSDSVEVSREQLEEELE